MASGRPSPLRGGLNIAKHPNHFISNARHVKKTASELKIFDNISTTPTSAPFSVNRVKEYSVVTSGTIVVVLEGTAEPIAGTWVLIDTLTNSDSSVQITSPFPSIRLRVTSSSGGTAWLFRKYFDGSE